MQSVEAENKLSIIFDSELCNFDRMAENLMGVNYLNSLFGTAEYDVHKEIK